MEIPGNNEAARKSYNVTDTHEPTMDTFEQELRLLETSATRPELQPEQYGEVAEYLRRCFAGVASMLLHPSAPKVVSVSGQPTETGKFFQRVANCAFQQAKLQASLLLAKQSVKRDAQDFYFLIREKVPFDYLNDWTTSHFTGKGRRSFLGTEARAAVTTVLPQVRDMPLSTQLQLWDMCFDRTKVVSDPVAGTAQCQITDATEAGREKLTRLLAAESVGFLRLLASANHHLFVGVEQGCQEPPAPVEVEVAAPVEPVAPSEGGVEKQPIEVSASGLPEEMFPLGCFPERLGRYSEHGRPAHVAGVKADTARAFHGLAVAVAGKPAQSQVADRVEAAYWQALGMSGQKAKKFLKDAAFQVWADFSDVADFLTPWLNREWVLCQLPPVPSMPESVQREVFTVRLTTLKCSGLSGEVDAGHLPLAKLQGLVEFIAESYPPVLRQLAHVGYSKYQSQEQTCQEPEISGGSVGPVEVYPVVEPAQEPPMTAQLTLTERELSARRHLEAVNSYHPELHKEARELAAALAGLTANLALAQRVGCNDNLYTLLNQYGAKVRECWCKGLGPKRANAMWALLYWQNPGRLGWKRWAENLATLGRPSANYWGVDGARVAMFASKFQSWLAGEVPSLEVAQPEKTVVEQTIKTPLWNDPLGILEESPAPVKGPQPPTLPTELTEDVWALPVQPAPQQLTQSTPSTPQLLLPGTADPTPVPARSRSCKTGPTWGQVEAEQKALLTDALHRLEKLAWSMAGPVNYVAGADMLEAIVFTREVAKSVRASLDKATNSKARGAAEWLRDAVNTVMESIGLGFDRPLALDAFAGGGGATEGLRLGGANVVAVEIDPTALCSGKREKGVWLVVGDAIAALKKYAPYFDYLHGSPPCQAHSRTGQVTGNAHADTASLLLETLGIVRASGLPYSVENVESPSVAAVMRDPLTLCGSMFASLPLLYRHRYFEVNFNVELPTHSPHQQRVTKMGRKHTPGERFNPVGHFTDVALGRLAMNMPWGRQSTIAQALPPEYLWFLMAEWLKERPHFKPNPGPVLAALEPAPELPTEVAAEMSALSAEFRQQSEVARLWRRDILERWKVADRQAVKTARQAAREAKAQAVAERRRVREEKREVREQKERQWCAMSLELFGTQDRNDLTRQQKAAVTRACNRKQGAQKQEGDPTHSSTSTDRYDPTFNQQTA